MVIWSVTPYFCKNVLIKSFLYFRLWCTSIYEMVPRRTQSDGNTRGSILESRRVEKLHQGQYRLPLGRDHWESSHNTVQRSQRIHKAKDFQILIIELSNWKRVLCKYIFYNHCHIHYSVMYFKKFVLDFQVLLYFLQIQKF